MRKVGLCLELRTVDPNDLGGPVMGFNVDGGSPRGDRHRSGRRRSLGSGDLRQGGPCGRRSDRGISASSIVAAWRLAWIHRKWLVRQGEERTGKEGTSNVGPVGDAQGRSAGQATNVVTDYVKVQGESRSQDTKFISAITSAYRQAFQHAAQEVRNDQGKTAKVKFTNLRSYYPFHLKESNEVVQCALAVGKSLGWEPLLRSSNGGLDANWLVRHGVPTITFGAGQNDVHTVDEYVTLPDFLEGRMALRLRTESR